jgi:plastocyanin/truncated hemoglobin YjbI
MRVMGPVVSISGRLAIGAIAAFLAGACGSSPPEAKARPPRAEARPAAPREPAGPPKTLYVRLGGKPAIEAVTREFVARLAADVRVKYRFANSDIAELTSQLVDFVCAASGGPCKYTGRPMRGLHAQMHITDEEWDATVEALIGALDKFKVGVAEKHEVLGAVGATRPDIVSPPEEKPSGEELARIDAGSRDLKRFGKHAEIMGAAFTALRRGQRSYADQLFSMVELWAGADKVADLAPLFRTGAPPRIDTPLASMPAESEPQPKGAVGGSDDDDPSAEARSSASLAGRLRLDGEVVEGAFGVVMLTPVKGPTRRRTPKQRVIEQRGRAFAPHLMAVPVGSTVAFPNFDPIYHNVFSRSDARPFDLGIFKNGQSREVTFDREGIVRIGCNLHANMSASIVVVGAPHYAVTDAKGAFVFRKLRPGTYTARTWTERSAEPVTRRIEVKPGANDVWIDATGGAAPGPSPDKFGAPRGPRR